MQHPPQPQTFPSGDGLFIPIQSSIQPFASEQSFTFASTLPSLSNTNFTSRDRRSAFTALSGASQDPFHNAPSLCTMSFNWQQPPNAQTQAEAAAAHLRNRSQSLTLACHTGEPGTTAPGAESAPSCPQPLTGLRLESLLEQAPQHQHTKQPSHTVHHYPQQQTSPQQQQQMVSQQMAAFQMSQWQATGQSMPFSPAATMSSFSEFSSNPNVPQSPLLSFAAQQREPFAESPSFTEPTPILTMPPAPPQMNHQNQSAFSRKFSEVDVDDEKESFDSRLVRKSSFSQHTRSNTLTAATTGGFASGELTPRASSALVSATIAAVGVGVPVAIATGSSATATAGSVQMEGAAEAEEITQLANFLEDLQGSLIYSPGVSSSNCGGNTHEGSIRGYVRADSESSNVPLAQLAHLSHPPPPPPPIAASNQRAILPLELMPEQQPQEMQLREHLTPAPAAGNVALGASASAPMQQQLQPPPALPALSQAHAHAGITCARIATPSSLPAAARFGTQASASASSSPPAAASATGSGSASSSAAAASAALITARSRLAGVSVAAISGSPPGALLPHYSLLTQRSGADALLVARAIKEAEVPHASCSLPISSSPSNVKSESRTEQQNLQNQRQLLYDYKQTPVPISSKDLMGVQFETASAGGQMYGGVSGLAGSSSPPERSALNATYGAALLLQQQQVASNAALNVIVSHEELRALQCAPLTSDPSASVSANFFGAPRASGPPINACGALLNQHFLGPFSFTHSPHTVAASSASQLLVNALPPRVPAPYQTAPLFHIAPTTTSIYSYTGGSKFLDEVSGPSNAGNPQQLQVSSAPTPSTSDWIVQSLLALDSTFATAAPLAVPTGYLSTAETPALTGATAATQQQQQQQQQLLVPYTHYDYVDSLYAQSLHPADSFAFNLGYSPELIAASCASGIADVHLQQQRGDLMTSPGGGVNPRLHHHSAPPAIPPPPPPIALLGCAPLISSASSVTFGGSVVAGGCESGSAGLGIGSLACGGKSSVAGTPDTATSQTTGYLTASCGTPVEGCRGSMLCSQTESSFSDSISSLSSATQPQTPMGLVHPGVGVSVSAAGHLGAGASLGGLLSLRSSLAHLHSSTPPPHAPPAMAAVSDASAQFAPHNLRTALSFRCASTRLLYTRHRVCVWFTRSLRPRPSHYALSTLIWFAMCLH